VKGRYLVWKVKMTLDNRYLYYVFYDKKKDKMGVYVPYSASKKEAQFA
jgi:hypothetical protein